ncbi:unnamed protein product [Parajaminaea phylloscopi]
MGNTPSSSTSRVPLGVNSLVAELGENEVQYEKSMGSSRFLKAVRARHAYGKIVVKTFIKPDASLSLRPLVNELRKERETLAEVPNVLTYQHVIETEQAGYLIRQWLASSLYDRISTRPFLTVVEKKWITYQLLFAMRACREHLIPHGDLKTENILVTTSLTCFITDFAAYFKPTYLPLDDPADFSLFFDTSGRRTCYIAPERFYAADSDIAKQKARARSGDPSGRGPHSIGSTSITSSSDPYSEILGRSRKDGKVTEAMDVFALGCVIAELWRDGTPTFTLSQLFKYREGQLDISPALDEIADAHVRKMVHSMLALDAKKRLTFSQYLADAQQGCFPRSFSAFLHPYLIEMQRATTVKPTPEGQRMAKEPRMAGTARPGPSQSTATRSDTDAGAEATAPIHADDLLVQRQADHRLDRFYEEWSVITSFLDDPPDEKEQSSGLGSPYGSDPTETEEELDVIGEPGAANVSVPIQLGIPGLPRTTLQDQRRHLTEDGPALIVLSPLLANLRNALRPTSKLHALDLLLHLAARWLTDEAKLDRVLPYFVALLDDPSPKVRAASVRSTAQLLMLVTTITSANENVCSEYVFPNLRRMLADPSPQVRTSYAACLPQLIVTAQYFIQQCQALQAAGALKSERDMYEDLLDPNAEEATYEAQMTELRGFAQEQVTAMLIDKASSVKRTLLSNLTPICRLFGASATNDVLLSHMITYLNDRDWLLRDAFFEAIVSVAIVGGPGSVEEYIVPLMIQALSDSEEFVTVRVLDGLGRLVDGGHLGRTRIYELISLTKGLLCHPNLWIRRSTIDLLAGITESLDATDQFALAYPSIRPLLKTEIPQITAAQLLDAAKSPLSRNTMQAALLWAASAKKTLFWKADHLDGSEHSRAGLGDGLGDLGLTLLNDTRTKPDVFRPLPRTEEDDSFLDKLRGQGLLEEDEIKLFALKDYLYKLSRAASRRSTPNSIDGGDGTSVPLAGHGEVQSVPGVTPQTIFFTHNDKRSTVGEDVASPIPHGSVRSVTDASFPNHIARKRLGAHRIVSTGSTSDYNVANNLRRRMASTTSTWATMGTPSPAGGVSDAGSLSLASGTPASPSGRPPLASPRSVSSSGQTKLGITKAAAAVSESAANATGTMGDLAARIHSMQVVDAKGADGSPASHDGTATPRARDYATRQQQQQATDGALFWSTYEGHDPYIQAHLETIFVRNFWDRHAELGSHVGTRSSRKRYARAPVGTGSGNPPASTSATGSARLVGRQVAYFNEHTAAITAIAVTTDHAFFATASEDGTVKVWDTARLEKNVTSQSRVTYSAHTGKITALLALDGTHCLVSTATDGGLHVWRVDVTQGSLPRYGKPRLVSNFQLSTPGEYVTTLLQSASQGAPVKLILGTSQSRITMLDLRTMQVLQSLRNPAHFGPITCMCSDKDRIWLLCGTLRGIIVLWDLRFGLMIKRWRVGPSTAGEGICDVKVTGCAPHPSKGRGRWVMISYEVPQRRGGSEPDVQSMSTLIETWDIDRGVLVETYESGSESNANVQTPASTIDAAVAATSSPRENTAVAPDRIEDLASPAAAIERLVRGRADGATGEEQLRLPDGASRPSHTHTTSPIGCHVKAFLVGTEAFPTGVLSSGTSTQSALPGGWLDAGKLAEDAAGEDSTDPSSAGKSAASSAARSGYGKGSAGYMISVGQDCRLRFWDLGRPDRSLCFGSVNDDRNNARSGFRLIPAGPSRSGGGDALVANDNDPPREGDTGNVTRYVHALPSTAQRRGQGSKTGSAALRSPLLSQQQSQQAQTYMRSHKDTVTAVAIIEWPIRAVVSGDRTGAIKVWD